MLFRSSHADLHDAHSQLVAAPAAVQTCIVGSAPQSSGTYASHAFSAAEGLDSHSLLACSANQAASIADLSLQHSPGHFLDGALLASPSAVNQEQQAHLAYFVNSLEDGSCDNTGHACHLDTTDNKHRSMRPSYASGSSSLCQLGNAENLSPFTFDAISNFAANCHEGIGAATSTTFSSMLANDTYERADSGSQLHYVPKTGLHDCLSFGTFARGPPAQSGYILDTPREEQPMPLRADYRTAVKRMHADLQALVMHGGELGIGCDPIRRRSARSLLC